MWIARLTTLAWVFFALMKWYPADLYDHQVVVGLGFMAFILVEGFVHIGDRIKEKNVR